MARHFCATTMNITLKDINWNSLVLRAFRTVRRALRLAVPVAVIGFAAGAISGHVVDSTPWHLMSNGEQAAWAGAAGTFLAFLGTLYVAHHQSGAETRKHRRAVVDRFAAVQSCFEVIAASLSAVRDELHDETTGNNARDVTIDYLKDGVSALQSIPVLDLPHRDLIMNRALTIRHSLVLADRLPLPTHPLIAGVGRIENVVEFVEAVDAALTQCMEGINLCEKFVTGRILP